MAWWETFFDQDFLEAYAWLYPVERNEREVEAVAQILGLRPGMRVLDLACGYGRHTILLAGQGCRAVGLDYSPTLLARARTDADAAGRQVHWVRGDMRALPWAETFDAVVNLFTSFGYFEREEDGAKVLGEVARALVPRGQLLIDLSHRDWLVRNFRQREWFRRGDLWVWEERAFDPLTGRLHVDHYWESSGRRGQRRFDLRIYTATEVAAMVQQAGLEVQGCYGDYDGTPFDMEAKRLLLVARKP